MIGLMVITAFVIWLIASMFLSMLITNWLSARNFSGAIGFVIFPIVFCAPIADDLIGMWQFKQLCKREAVVELSPDWQKVKRAKWVDYPVGYINQFTIPIRSHGGQYIDIDRNVSFMTYHSFFTNGGFLRRSIQIFGTSSCHPINFETVNKEINLNKLMKNGEKE